MKRKKEILTIGSCHLFAALTYVFFAPMEVILLNSTEFHYTFGSFWWFQVLLALGAAVLLTLITAVLPRKIRTGAAALSLGAGTAAWIQMMFMNGKMVRLTGNEMEVSAGETAVNLIIWIGIAAAIFIAAVLLEKKGKPVRTWMSMLAGLLTAMQLVAFVSLVMTTDVAGNRDGHRFTKQNEFELGKGSNVIVFLTDGADGEYVDQMFEAYPEVKEQLNGWTYYPNATSRFSRTFPSLTYMLSGGENRLNIPVKEYVDTSFEKSDFLRNIHAAGTDIGIYTMDNAYVSTKMDDIISNAQRDENRFSDLKLVNLEKGLMKISLFKCLPYAGKKLVKYDMGILNVAAFKAESYSWHDPYVYDSLAADRLKTTDRYTKAFRFYHLWSAHRSAWWNEKLQKCAEEVPSYERLRGSFLLVEAYCEEMKELGIYDDATIIIVADHGEANGDSKNLVQNRAACPLLMVKWPHSEEKGELEISWAPVSHDDLFATITDALGAERPNAGSGKTIRERAEGEEGERYYYYTAEDGRGDPKRMVEYVIRGDAEEFGNWEATGNEWPALIDW